MNKLMTATAAAALLAASSLTAFAAEVTGAITAVDVTTGTVTLDDGKTYQLPADFDVSTLAAGTQVTFTYDEADGKYTVTAVGSPG
jgi:Cu/Ag efflux protein CusF